MMDNISFRPGSFEELAEEYKRLSADYPEIVTAPLDPAVIELDNVMAVHVSTCGAQGESGAVNILYCIGDKAIALHGNYSYGGLDIKELLKHIPMLTPIVYEEALPPFSGRVPIPEGWSAMYMGCLNYLFIRSELVQLTEEYIQLVCNRVGSWCAFDSLAWLCGIELEKRPWY